MSLQLFAAVVRLKLRTTKMTKTNVQSLSVKIRSIIRSIMTTNQHFRIKPTLHNIQDGAFLSRNVLDWERSSIDIMPRRIVTWFSHQ